MTNKKIFDDLDHLIGNKMMVVNMSIQDIAGFLNQKKIPLTSKMRQPLTGEDESDIQCIGDVLIRSAKALTQFLAEYRELKDTWGVTSPSPVLDDEK